MRNLRVLLFFAAAASFIATPAVAQSVADFYKGKQLILIVGASTGGGYDAQGRLLARHIGKHIPGNPNVIVQNMPGAGSLQATNHLYNVAPKDGTVFGLIQRDMLVAKVMNASGIRFDIEKFNWIGNLASEIGIVVAWHTSPIKTTADLFKSEMIVGGTGPTIDTETAPRLMNSLIGTKFRIVSGYQGTTEVLLAMERGEVMGLGDWSLSNIRSRNPQMLQEGKIRLLMQTALTKSPDLPDVPLALDFAKSSGGPPGDGGIPCAKIRRETGPCAARDSRRPRSGAARGVYGDRCRSGVHQGCREVAARSQPNLWSGSRTGDCRHHARAAEPRRKTQGSHFRVHALKAAVASPPLVKPGPAWLRFLRARDQQTKLRRST